MHFTFYFCIIIESGPPWNPGNFRLLRCKSPKEIFVGCALKSPALSLMHFTSQRPLLHFTVLSCVQSYMHTHLEGKAVKT
jgi:hypothetical protein